MRQRRPGATSTWPALVTRLAPGRHASRPATRASRAPSLLPGVRGDRAPDTNQLATARTARPGASRSTVKQAAPGIEPAAAWQSPRGELRCAQFNITGCCTKCGQSRAMRAWWPHRFASALARRWPRPSGSRNTALCLAPRGACNTSARARQARRSIVSAPAARESRIQCPPAPGRSHAGSSPSSLPALRAALPGPRTAARARVSYARATPALAGAGARKIGKSPANVIHALQRQSG